jgi:V8-like Glu-specific endopeptidase
MNEQTEPQRTGARARALLGGAAAGAGGNTESAGGGSGPPNATDVALIAARIQYYSNLSAEEARAIAAQLTEQARVAVTKLLGGATDTALSDDEVMSLESVIYVRSRPAVRIMGQQGDRLEGLEKHPGSELWQDFITDCEQRIISAARATGAAMVMALNTGAPELVSGSAWLVTPNRVITNRHVLQNRQMNMLVAADGGGKRIGDDYSLVIEFTFDNRKTMTKTRQRVTDVLYVSEPADPIDIAVLGIEGAGTPLAIASSATPTPKNLYVVGHPGLSLDVSAPVKAVFGNPDGRKRVSFGKFVTSGPSEFGHDASTIGGYSGGPVVGICDGVVAGLHYYGDPANGNLAISAAAIRAHAAFGHCQ